MATSYDLYWKKEQNWKYWNEPSERVIKLVQTLAHPRGKNALDLGCGIGRHTLYLAKAGFKVTALDSSEEALSVLRETVVEKNLDVKIVQADYCQDIFEKESFDFIVAFNVIYHGFKDDVKLALNLIHKWLKPGGILFFTCPTIRDAKYGTGEFIAPKTYRPLKSIHIGDIHYFADAGDISELLSSFKIISRMQDEHYWNNDGTLQFSSYWQITAQKK